MAGHPVGSHPVLIEFGQAALLPHRVASVGDVIANTLGGILGTLAAVAIAAVRARNRRGLEPPA